MRRAIPLTLAALCFLFMVPELLPHKYLAQVENAASAAEISPSKTYLDYHKALMSATTVDAVAPFMSKTVIQEIGDTPESMKPVMFALMKEMTPKTVQVTGEKIDGDKATLTLLGNSSSSQQADPARANKEVNNQGQGVIDLIREDGAWKIDKESWKTSTVITGAPSNPPKEQSAENPK